MKVEITRGKCEGINACQECIWLICQRFIEVTYNWVNWISCESCDMLVQAIARCA